MFKNISIEKATISISLLGLIVSLALAECNRRAGIELEEKRIESALFLKAIEVNNKKTTLENLTFLLKMGALSSEREKVLQNLTDSIYSDKQNGIYTSSDSVGFLLFTIYNSKKDIASFYKLVRGACIQIDSRDSIMPLHIVAYSDYQGQLDISYPKYYSGTFVNIKVIKKGYKTQFVEKRLPIFGGPGSTNMEITLQPDD